MPFKDITLDQLRAATKEQILTRLTDILTDMTKKRLSEWIWTIKDISPGEIRLETLTVNHDVPQGQLHRVHEITNILGTKLGSQKTDWTYYPTGEVDTITISELDALDQRISQKRIKHFIDGRQPVVST